MSIKRYIADLDNTITNAYRANLRTRGTGSNMGASDIVEVFSIYGQEASSSVELTRCLLQFPIDTISTDRTNGDVPASGKVDFYLRMYNAAHAFTLPKDYKISIQPVSRYWQEGIGLDMENYTDLTYDGSGSNWVNASSGASGVVTWSSEGGDVLANTLYTASFTTGVEDIEIDITSLVEDWIAGTKDNYGIRVALSASYEASSSDNPNGARRSYYTKKFFGRNSEFFFKRPSIEARWDSSRQDDRGKFHFSSSLATAADNMHTLTLYNYVHGQLKDIPDIETGPIYVSVFSGSYDNTVPTASSLILVEDGTYVRSTSNTVVTGGWSATGIYTASFAVTAAATPVERMFDVWFGTGSTTAKILNVQYHTASFVPTKLNSSNENPTSQYVTKIVNLKPSYTRDEVPKMRLFIREKDWNPNIYIKATSDIPNYTIDSGSFRVFRVADDLPVVAYGTGSANTGYTRMSYDVSGSYFNLDMSLLEAGFAYGIKFAYYINGTYVEQPETFKFRVD